MMCESAPSHLIPRAIPDVANRENYKIATKFSPVNQEKFLIDFKRFELHYYNEATQKLTKYCSFPEDKGLLDFVHELGEGARSIVYSNSKDNVVEYALQYAAQLQPLHNSDLDVLAQDIRQDVHGDYYLADIVEKGVAYHMGYLPSTIRARIESLYKDGKIHTLFCTSTLLEGVNLPADNLFITSHKNGGDMSPVDFRNLMGRVGRIEFNLYGNVFLVCIKRKTKKERFLHLLQEKIVPQQLSLATALTQEQKTGIVSVLKSGQAEIPKDGSLPPAEYSLIRKVANILLKDIVSGRASRVKKEFSDVLSPEDEAAIAAAFAGREHSLDDDINLSLDQTERLAREIRSGRLHYPAIRIGGKADYNELRSFLERLCDIFKWETYEYDTLGFQNKSSGAHTKLSHYAFVLNQWVSGMSLNHMVTDSIDYYLSTGKGKVKLKGQYVAFKNEPAYAITPERIEAMLSKGSLSGLYDAAKVDELENAEELTGKDLKKLETFQNNKPVFDAIVAALQAAVSDTVYYSPAAFMPALAQALGSGMPVPAGEEPKPLADKKLLEKIADGLSIMDKKAEIQHDRKGNVLYDKETKDTEIVPFEESIDTYMAREVLPHIPDAKAFFEENLGAKKPVIKTGAEILFTRYFYKYQQPTASEELETRFMELELSVSERVARLFE